MKLKIYAIAVIAFQVSFIANGQIELLKDISPLKYVSGPGGGIVYKDFIYYQGGDDITGYELWRTDGSLEGTSLFKDINQGSGYSFPGRFIIFNDILYFTAADANGGELWRTDGTTAGTRLVADINAGSGSSNPKDLVIVNDKLFFRATTPAFGTELWVTNGSPEGTMLVKDIYPGSGSSDYTDGITFEAGESIAAFNGYAYFYADDGTPGAELWKTDGTPAGTVLVKDMHDTVAKTYISFMVVVNSRLVLGTLNEYTVRLWTSDGTTSGTETLGNLGVWGSGNQYPTSRNILNNYLFFPAVNLENGNNYNNELWRTDGTIANTQQVAEISSDPEAGSSIMNIIATDSEIYFAARSNNDPTSSKLGLCKSNGTIGNFTVIDTSFVSGFAPTNMAFFNGQLCFSAARDYTVYEQFFTYDGSSVTGYNLPLPSTVYMPDFFMELNNNLFFNGSGLMKFDGTDLTRIGSNSYHSSNPSTFTDAGNGITYFVSDDGTNGAELWRTDGTYNGTSLVKNVNPTAGSNPTQFKMFNGKLYFAADDGSHGVELWKSDGTEAGTVLVSDISPGTPNSNPNSLTISGDALYFAGQGGLWKVIGEGSPVLVTTNVIVSPRSLAVSAPYLFFAGYDESINKCALFKTDGTGAGTSRLADNLSGCFGPSNEVSDLAVMGSKIYFSGIAANFQSELWVYDGATSAPVKANVDGGPSQPGNYTVIGNTLFFGATDATHGYELWKTDGTAANTMIVKDIKVGTGTSLYTPPQHGPPFPPHFNRISFNNKLFFTADDNSHGFEVWVTDGTDEGTYMVNDLAPGALSGGPTNFVALDSSLYFLGSDGNPNNYLTGIFVTNGLSCGTRKLSSSTYITSTPQNLMVSGSKLFVSLKEQMLGQEPFTIDPSQIQPPPPGCGPPKQDPITQPTALVFSTITDNSVVVSFNASSTPGAGYVTLMRAYESPYPESVPVDGTSYQVGNVIGSSAIVVGVGSQTSFTVTYLNPGTTYYFDVFAFDANHDYLTINPLAGSQATNEEGSAPSTDLLFSDVTDNSMTVSFAASDPAPDGYIAVMKAFSSSHPTDVPQNGTAYQVGSVIGGSSIVVGFGSATSLNVVYLNADTEYFFNVYSYTQNAGSYSYLIASPFAGSQRTSAAMSLMARKEEQSAYPNPFTDALTIPFETKNDNTPVRIVIYDQLGRLIADVVNNTFNVGNHEVRWDRTDIQGNKVQGGLYVYHIKNADSGKVKQGFVVAK